MKNKVLLTFDDSPSMNFGELIEFLQFKNIPAIFFCRGDLLAERKEEVKQAINKGFIIANHAWGHQYFSNLNLTKSLEEIRRTDTLINEIYQDCKQQKFPKLFRFPYGDIGDLKYGRPTIFHLFKRDRKSLHQFFRAIFIGLFDPFKLKWKRKSQKIYELLNNLGYSNLTGGTRIDMGWTLDCGEWKYRDGFKTILINEIVEEIWLNFNLKLKRNNGSIDLMLIHDYDWNLELTKGIIEKCLMENVSFITPGQYALNAL